VDTRTSHLVRSSALASRPEYREQLREEILAARDSGSLDRRDLYEAFLQLYLFAGFPAALESLRALEKNWPHAAKHADARGDAEAVGLGMDYKTYLERGRSLYARIYAKNAEVVEREMLRLSPDLAAWAVVEGYGKTLSRENLHIVARELCIVSVLTQLGWDRQLFSHILGAKNVGASNEDILEAIDIGSLGDQAKRARGESLLNRA
jgi:alkylhydroperoxidase/carboxymuconolactone decarboxylase family protein YurZ